MFYQYSLKFINTFTKFYFNGFTQPLYKFKTLQFKFQKEIYTLATQCYCEHNPSVIVAKKYDAIYEEKLNTILQDPYYKALYDKYKLEIMYIKYSSQNVPQNIRPYNWLRLLQTKSKGERRAYLTFLWKLEMHEENKKLKKLKRQNLVENNDSCYGLGKYSLFYRIRKPTMSHFYNSKLISAILFNPILVMDVGYDEYMTPHEQENCAKQLLLTFSLNRQHIFPFNLYFCNVTKQSFTMQKIHRTLPNLFEPDFPINVTSKSYLDLFDKKKLVYLSPNAQETMQHFDNNLIYIIGAMHAVKPYSFQKANKEGIRMMKLPLNEKLEWGTGSSKNLPINQVASILLDINHSNNWDVAFKNIPQRKLKKSREHASMRQVALKNKEFHILK
ncbi:Mitochondrial ribonuclease P protein 1 like protein [Eufriesea mexicana]|uniref:RNA (guanine-9-)-methyltransferase domain-containing protein 1 n=1 Tax=Eufriesea mexicana TaxID=516756 RepID=A0A310SRX7_9HYME|nr:Mitochondrial ribonuclease P protein 1 like protein [Eufriesea mexicana]